MAPVPAEEKVHVDDPEVTKKRKDAWLLTRQIGFASFIIPSTIIMIMLYNADPKVREDLTKISFEYDGSVAKTILYFVVWVNIEVFLNVFKYYLCKQWYGMSQEDYFLIIGRRDRWSLREI
jgi:hypothetical protein